MAKDFQISDIKKAIKDSAGIISTISKRLGCDWHTAKKYIFMHEETKQMYENENETMLDMAESMLFQNIQEQDPASIFFYLKTKGKKRGYIEKVQTEHSGEMKTTVVNLGNGTNPND